jgi:hypothetical protein
MDGGEDEAKLTNGGEDEAKLTCWPLRNSKQGTLISARSNKGEMTIDTHTLGHAFRESAPATAPPLPTAEGR